MKMKYVVLFIFVTFFCCCLYLFLDPKIYKDDNKTSNINVYLNDELNSIELGSTFKDLLDINNLGINETYNISLEYILSDNEYIYLDDNLNDNLISINEASKEELMSLPNIGEKTANKIIEYRNIYGSFKHIEEIKNVSGIGDKKYEKIKELITI